jgi:O-antigen ligase
VVSAYGNDLIVRYLGTKPYLSWISGLTVLIAFLGCGTTMRSLKTTLGRLGLALALWMLIAIPFSHWPRGSLTLMQSYLPRLHAVIFYSGAILITFRQCRTVVISMLVASAAVLFSCFQSGDMETGRLLILNSSFFDNPNDLGLFLVSCIGFWAYPLLSKRIVARVLGGAGGLITVYYLLKTGSRGSFIAFAAVFLTCTLLSKRRIIAIALLIPAVGLLLLISPGATLHRLALLTEADAEGAQGDDAGSIGSQINRQELLKLSIKYTIAHPIFGVGASQFSDTVFVDYKQQGIHMADVSTHNTYTQLSSENGIPALVLFIGMIWLTIRNNYRLYRRIHSEKYEQVSRMAFAVMVSGVALAVNLMFHHVGYTMYIPSIVGLSVALEMAAREIPAGEI